MINIDVAALLLFVAEVLLALAAAIYVSANRKPSSAIAWVLAVIFIPVIGILFFLLVGAGRLPKHRRDKQHFVTTTIQEKTEGGLDQLTERKQWPDWLPSIATLNWNLGALPMIGRQPDADDVGADVTGRLAHSDRRRWPSSPRVVANQVTPLTERSLVENGGGKDER